VNMDRTLQIARIALALAGAFAFCVVGGLLWIYVPQIANRAITAEDKLNGALDTMNRGGGILANVDGAARGVRLTADAFGRIAWHEQKRAGAVDREVDQVFADAHTALVGVQITSTHMNTTADAATGLLRSSQAATDAATTAIAENAPALHADLLNAGNVLDHLDGKLTDPQLQRAVTGIADTTTHIAGLSGDLQVKLHPVLNPEPCKSVKCKILRRVWSGLDTSARLGDGAYWSARFIQLFR